MSGKELEVLEVLILYPIRLFSVQPGVYLSENILLPISCCFLSLQVQLVQVPYLWHPLYKPTYMFKTF